MRDVVLHSRHCSLIAHAVVLLYIVVPDKFVAVPFCLMYLLEQFDSAIRAAGSLGYFLLFLMS